MVDTEDTRQRTMNDGRWTTPGVRHKLPTGELKNTIFSEYKQYVAFNPNDFIRESNENKAYRPNAHLSDILIQL